MRAVFEKPMLQIGVLLALCFLAFFVQLGAYGLFDLDEALYANCAREMNLNHDFIVPTVNGQPFFEKPPLIYWEAAVTMKIFGQSELAARLPSAFASLFVVGGVFLFGRRFLSARSAFMASAFLAVTPMIFGTARQLTTDATLDLCIFTALACFWWTQSTDKKAHLASAGFWISCALGVLAKGLPGILIPCVVATITLLLINRGKLVETLKGLNKLQPIWGIPLLIFIALPWHLLAWQQAGKAFTDEYIVRQHLQRFRGGDTSHLAPFWFFVPAFLLGAFPWSFFTFFGLRRPAGTEELAKTRVFLKVWTLTVFVMFSASGSKLVSYILPLYPAAALLTADWLDGAFDRKEETCKLFGVGMFGTILAGVLTLIMAFHSQVILVIEGITHKSIPLDQIPPGTFLWVTFLFASATLATLLWSIWIVRIDQSMAVLGMVGGMAVFIGSAVFWGLPIIQTYLLDPLQSMAQVAGDRAMTSDKMPIILVTGRTRRPSAIFYLPDNKVNSKVKSYGVTEITDPKEAESYIFTFLRSTVVVCSEADLRAIGHADRTVIIGRRQNMVAAIVDAVVPDDSGLPPPGTSHDLPHNQ